MDITSRVKQVVTDGPGDVINITGNLSTLLMIIIKGETSYYR